MNPADRQALRDFVAFLREEPIRFVRLAVIIIAVPAGLTLGWFLMDAYHLLVTAVARCNCLWTPR